MIRAFRLCKSRHVASAFTGEGARLFGGRWNSPGMAMVYTSSSLSLATLEVMVHLDDAEAFSRLFSWIPVSIPEDAVEVLDESKLPSTWLADETNSSSRSVGDAWLRSHRSAVLAVPSVVTPGELNYLLHPLHHRFADLEIGTATPFRPDPRLRG
jgi:RES domain-containing protein